MSVALGVTENRTPLVIETLELSLLTGNYQVRTNGYRDMMPGRSNSACIPRRTPMLWLIWIAIMLLTPVLAGIVVWRQILAQPREMNIAEMPNDGQLRRSP
jgi:hypothetical protein